MDLVCPFQQPKEYSQSVDGLAIKVTRYAMHSNFTLLEIDVSREEDAIGSIQLTPSLCHLGMLTSGEATLYIPELGKRHIEKGEWFLGAMDGLPLRLEVSSHLTFFAIECDVAVFSNILAGTKAHEQRKLNCLACPERKQPFFEKGPVAGKLARLGSAIGEIKSDSLSQRLALESKIFDWLSVLLEQPELNQKADCRKECKLADEEALLAAAKYLEKYLSEDHSIAKISREIHLNEFKLKKGFRQLFDTTVFGYLREKRMEHAGELLKGTSSSVIEVANAVGYSNPSHFARAFKEHHGILPKSFQKVYVS